MNDKKKQLYLDFEALSKMTDGKDNKVIYMPYEASNVLGAVAAIKDLTGGAPTPTK